MKVVPRSGRRRGQRLVALVEPDVIKAMPFEEYASGRDVDLLNDPVDHLAAARTATRGKVSRHGVVDRDEADAVRHELCRSFRPPDCALSFQGENRKRNYPGVEKKPHYFGVEDEHSV